MILMPRDTIYLTSDKGIKKIGKVIKIDKVTNGERFYLCQFGHIQASVSEKKLTQLYLNLDIKPRNV